jgi:hypothetical protein
MFTIEYSSDTLNVERRARKTRKGRFVVSRLA